MCNEQQDARQLHAKFGQILTVNSLRDQLTRVLILTTQEMQTGDSTDTSPPYLLQYKRKGKSIIHRLKIVHS